MNDAEDAARYRWLRDHGHGNTDRTPQAWIAVGSLHDGVAWVKGTEADAAVDEAMRKWPSSRTVP